MTELDPWCTDRRREILLLSANGNSNAAIAGQLWLSEETVKSHMQVIKRALGATDRTHAAVLALVRGIIRPHEIPLPAPKQPPRTKLEAV